MKTRLETDRMRLREFTIEDAPLLVELDGDPAVMRFITDGAATPLEKIRDEMLPRWMRWYERAGGFGCWAAMAKRLSEQPPHPTSPPEGERGNTEAINDGKRSMGGGEFLGWFFLRPVKDTNEIELGYRLKRAAWGRGLATEGSRALVRKGFEELGVERIMAKAMAANTASIRVMQKVGLQFVCEFEEDLFVGADKRAVRYAIDREVYQWQRWKIEDGSFGHHGAT